MGNSTKGVLVFARNNAQIDYVKQAYFPAKQIKKFCDLSTSWLQMRWNMLKLLMIMKMCLIT